MNGAKQTVDHIPVLTVNAGPKDGDQWIKRLKEEYMALIKYVELNKADDNDWFKIEMKDQLGTKWAGKCWYIHNLVKFEFDLQFEIPPTYPMTPIELELPELDGKTAKMYRGGKICLDIHFTPLWQKNTPKFGIAHALALALGPWLAIEVPQLIEEGKIRKN